MNHNREQRSAYLQNKIISKCVWFSSVDLTDRCLLLRVLLTIYLTGQRSDLGRDMKNHLPEKNKYKMEERLSFL